MKIISMIICVCILTGGIAFAGRHTHYVIDKDVTVLAFVGPLGSKKAEAVKYITAKRQVITLLHKRSGPGIWAFYLNKLMVRDEKGDMQILDVEGFFITKRRLVKPFM